MHGWYVTTVALFIAGLVLPVVGAIRTYARGAAILARQEWVHRRTQEIQAERRAIRDSQPKIAEIGAKAWDVDQTRFNGETIALYEAEGLVPPTIDNLDMTGTRVPLGVLTAVFSKNRINLSLIIAGPVISTVASVIALFPAWLVLAE
jgi:hypothetical protein